MIGRKSKGGGRQSKGGGSHVTDTMVNIVYTLWGLGRDRGGVLKPAQVIKIFPGEKQARCDTEPHGLSKSRAGLSWPVREQGWAVGFCRWLGRECAVLSDHHSHPLRVFVHPQTPE